MTRLATKANVPYVGSKRIYTLETLESIMECLNSQLCYIHYEDEDNPFEWNANLSRTCGYVKEGTAKMVKDYLEFDVCWENRKIKPSCIILPDDPSFNRERNNLFQALDEIDSLHILPVVSGKVTNNVVEMDEFLYLAACPGYYNVTETTTKHK
jgi:hypothetical protein